jgi:hypothetical protein
MALSSIGESLREMSFPRGFAKWLIALEDSLPATHSSRKADCFSMI